MTKIFAIVNQKGGVGKTTTAVNLAAIMAIADKKSLLIDLDSQGNSSSGLGISQNSRKKTSYDLFISSRSQIQDLAIKTTIPALDIIPANTNLAAVEQQLYSSNNQEYILRDIISNSDIDEYEYIFIDCPPALNLLTLNALTAASSIIIPMLCDFYSLEGLSHLIKTVEIIKNNFNNQIKIAGIVFTMYDRRSKLTRQVEEDVRNHLGDMVYNTTIPRNITLSEAPSHGKAAVIYDYKCQGAKAYIDLAKEIISKEELLA